MPLLARNKPFRARALISRPRALTASAEPARQSDRGLRRLDQEWQREAMLRYDDTGEVWNPAQFYARAMERIRFYPAMRSDRGDPQEITEGPIFDLFNRIRSPSGAPGDLSIIAGQYGRLHFVIGDGLLTTSDDEEGEEIWEYLSPMEMRLMPNSDPKRRQEYRRIRAPGLTQEQLIEAPDNEFEPLAGESVRVSRLWRQHPAYSQWADSPIRPILELYALLHRLTLAVYAEASSRAAQRGLLYVPDELEIESIVPSQEENPEEDALIQEIVTSMERSIRNPASAEAMAPFILRGPGVLTSSAGSISTAELIKWIALGPGDRYVEGEMWERTISRIAGAIDMPKEFLTGIADVSHWGGWLLEEQGFRLHTGPTVVRFCNDVSGAYLRPAARDADIADADRAMIWFDPSQAVSHPDQTNTALKAHDQLLISDDYAREQIGAPDTAAPGPAELKRRTMIKLKEDPYADGQDPRQGQTNPADGGTGGDVSKEPPAGPVDRPVGNKPPAQNPSLSDLIVGAATMQVDRARELAGHRLWRRAQACEDCKDDAKDVPRELIAFTLGRERVASVIAGHASEQSLVEGIGETFAARLRAWDVNNGWDEQLGQMVEQHALRTLYLEVAPPLPAGFVAACRRAVE